MVDFNKKVSGKLKILLDKVKEAKEEKAKIAKEDEGTPENIDMLSNRLKSVYLKKLKHFTKEIEESEDFMQEMGADELSGLTKKEISKAASNLAMEHTNAIARQNGLEEPFQNIYDDGSEKPSEAADGKVVEKETKDSTEAPSDSGALLSNL